MLDATSTYVIYGVLSLLLLLCLTNAMNHFVFRHECPFIMRDVEVDGIYPTLLMLYIAVSCALCTLILVDPSPPSDIHCSFNPSVDSLYRSCATWLFIALIMLEQYQCLTRWYNVYIGGSHNSHTSMNSFFALHCFALLILSWLALTVFPLLALAIAFFDI